MPATPATETNISDAVEAPLLDNDVVDGNVDYKGRPAKLSKSGRWKSASFIIGLEMADRFAYSGISGNLISYLTGPLGQATATAAENVNAWSGTAELFPLLGAFVADSFLGRYRTIGLGFLTLSTVFTSVKSSECQNGANAARCSPSEFQVIFFFSALYLVAVGHGGFKSSVQAFGADQFDGQDPEESKAKSSFFNWWNFGVGGAVSVTLVILIYIQDNLSWGLGFGIPCLVIGFALIFFLLGTVTYRFCISSEEMSPFVRIGRVFLKAALNWRTTSSVISIEEESGGFLPCQGCQQFKFLNKALLSSEGSKGGRNACSIREVEEAKAVLRLFPIWATCLVYGIVFSQSSTLFTKQGATMDRSISPSFEVPPASLQLLLSLSLVAFISIYDRILVPIARAITGKQSGITMLQRIGTGIVLSCLSMVIAALVEMKRLQTAQEYGLVDKPKATVPMSLVWLVPQYLILGVSEALAMVGSQEFFYDQVPSGLRSTGLALFISIIGVGSFLSSFLISVLEKATAGMDIRVGSLTT